METQLEKRARSAKELSISAFSDREIFLQKCNSGSNDCSVRFHLLDGTRLADRLKTVEFGPRVENLEKESSGVPSSLDETNVAAIVSDPDGARRFQGTS